MGNASRKRWRFRAVSTLAKRGLRAKTTPYLRGASAHRACGHLQAELPIRNSLKRKPPRARVGTKDGKREQKEMEIQSSVHIGKKGAQGEDHPVPARRERAPSVWPSPGRAPDPQFAKTEAPSRASRHQRWETRAERDGDSEQCPHWQKGGSGRRPPRTCAARARTERVAISRQSSRSAIR